MQICLKHQTIERKNSNFCVVTEHHLNDEQIDFAIVKVNGRYPDRAYAVNRKCKEVVYIQNGTGQVTVDGIEHKLNEGDVVLIEAGEKFFWEGNMNLHIACHPAFTVEQHELVN